MKTPTWMVQRLLVVLCGMSLYACNQLSHDCVNAGEPSKQYGRPCEAWPHDRASARQNREEDERQGAASEQERVVFLGDSITRGWDDVRTSIGVFAGKPYINRGVNAQTTAQMLVRFRSDVIALKPRVVVIAGGINDLAGVGGPVTLDAIEANLASMADLAMLHHIGVVLASVLPINDYARDANGKSILQSSFISTDQLVMLNAWLQAYATEHGHTFLDYYSSMLDARGFLRADLSDDGLHPNENGYAVMAPLLERAISAAKGPSGIRHRCKVGERDR